MPNRPKPPERRQRARPTGSDAKATNLALLPSVGGVPEAPKGLLKDSRGAWEAFWRSPMARLVATDTDLDALVRLFTLRDDRARAHKLASKQLMVKGSTGQVRLNPAWDLIKSLDSEIRALEDRFGLTPKARLQVGAQFGDAARSLDELNERFRRGEGDEGEDDPRLSAVLESPQDG